MVLRQRCWLLACVVSIVFAACGDNEAPIRDAPVPDTPVGADSPGSGDAAGDDAAGDDAAGDDAAGDDAAGDDAAPDACPDSDGDTVCDAVDVCPGSDDRVDTDGDEDPDGCDNCPAVANGSQANSDGDSLGDACDNCPNDDNEDQALCALDAPDGRGDACDDDDDGDGALDGADSADCNRCLCNDSDGDTCDDCASVGCVTIGTDAPANDGTECGDERGGPDGLCDAGDVDDDNDGCPDSSDTVDCNDTTCGDCAAPSDGDGCDDCQAGSGPPSGLADGPDCDADGRCATGDADDDGDGVTDQSFGGTDTADGDPRRCSDVDADTCDDCAVVNAGAFCGGTVLAGNPNNDGTDTDAGGICDLGDNCDDDVPESQANSDGDAYGDVCDVCPGGNDDEDVDGDTVPSFCDNCPNLANLAQADSDPVCGSGGDPSEGAVADLGDDCDNCNAVCNDQTNTYGIRATALPFPIAISPGDCVDSTGGYTGETDDLELGDDRVSQCFDLDDENADGTAEAGDFAFSFFGQSIDAIRIANNGFVLLYPTMAECLAADDDPLDGPGFTHPAPPGGGGPPSYDGTIPRFDGTDNLVAAGWTDLKASSFNPSGTTDPCVSLQVLSSNGSSSQIMEVTWEFMRLQNDNDDDQPITMQIRLHEGGRITITSAPFNSNLEASEIDQTATRGVEGLFTDGSTDVTAAAYLGAETANPSDDEVNSVLQLTSSSVELTTNLSPAAETALEETGDACDNLVIQPRCGDAFCHFGGGECSLDPPSDFDLYFCGDCACGDGVCDFCEDEDAGGIFCGSCPTDCNPPGDGVPARDGCCGDATCDTDEGEDASPGGLCGTCHQDCGPCCGDGTCDAGEGPFFFCGTCNFDCGDPPCCGNGICDFFFGENTANCPADCPFI